jgi:hypothetical protein
MRRGSLIRGLLLVVSVIVTFSALVLALPSEAPKITLQGEASVNQGFWGLSVLKRHKPLQPISVVAFRGVLT